MHRRERKRRRAGGGQRKRAARSPLTCCMRAQDQAPDAPDADDDKHSLSTGDTALWAFPAERRLLVYNERALPHMQPPAAPNTKGCLHCLSKQSKHMLRLIASVHECSHSMLKQHMPKVACALPTQMLVQPAQQVYSRRPPAHKRQRWRRPHRAQRAHAPAARAAPPACAFCSGGGGGGVSVSRRASGPR